MRILTILFVLAIAISAEAAKKVFVTYLINGTVKSINVARLSENMVVEKVVSKTLPTAGGLTSIQVGNNPNGFSIYYNHRPVANGPVKISRIDVDVLGNDISLGPTKTLGDKSTSLLNLSINNGIGSVQLSNNTIGRFQLNQNTPQEFKNVKRDTLPGQPYASSEVRLVTPSGANEFHGSLFLFNRNGAQTSNVFFRNVNNGTAEQPRFAQFVGPDQPRNMTLARGCGRTFFFGSYFRTSPLGNAQIGLKIQELGNNDFHSIGPNRQIDQFRDHRNPDLAYFRTAALALHEYETQTCRMFPVYDRFNNAKNSNDFYGSVYNLTNSSGPTRSVSPKKLNLPIPNNSSAYGADVEVIDIDN